MDDGSLQQAGASMAAPAGAPPWRILVVDDEVDVHSVTGLVLDDFEFDGRRLEFLHAYTGTEAMTAFANYPDIAVALIDVVMETEDAGLRLVRHIREAMGNRFVRIILRTGQPGAAPEREVITRYDINDYKAKTELSALKLYSAMTTALRSYRDIIDLDRQRRGVARMLDAAGELFGAGSVGRFAQIALPQLCRVLDVEATAAFYADGGNSPALLASIGAGEELAGRMLASIIECGAASDQEPFRDAAVIVSLATRYAKPHVLCAEMAKEASDLERALVELFRLNATSALDNLLLLEKNQAAQRQAIRALAHLAPYRQRGTAALPGAQALAGVAAGDDAIDFFGFLRQLAVLAETREWGEDGAVGHVERIGCLARLLAERADMRRDFCEAIGQAAELHDIGKMFVAPSGSSGWYESGRDKRQRAGEHALWGGEFLQGFGVNASEAAKMAAQIALHHHEAWDGQGYPAGLSGSAIPVAARIVAIVDFFDTCVNFRPDGNPPAATRKDAFDLVAAAAGYYFDPVLVKVFLRNRGVFATF